MGVSSFFRRVKNFLWGLLFMAVGIGGAVVTGIEKCSKSGNQSAT